MNATDLYLALERDFITSAMTYDWSEMPDSTFVTENFKKRSMGLVCDNAATINKVYTAVFPSKLVMQSIIDKEETDIMLFVRHPMVWDIRKEEVFAPIDSELLAQF